jgi:hypothetical protein
VFDARRTAAFSIVAIGILLAAFQSRRAVALQDPARGGRWYKGNPHAHPQQRRRQHAR